MAQADPIREQSLERSLPNSAEAERAILGGIILDNGLIMQATDLLTESDFYVPSHRRVFAAMKSLTERGSEINPILIAEELKRNNLLETVGGISFITNLTYGLPHSTNVKHYAKVVKGKSNLRELIRTANRITQSALEEEDEPEAILNDAQQAIFDLGNTATERRAQSMKQITINAAKVVQGFVKGENPGLPTPWPELNNLCRGGIQESELWGIAALAKSGKALALDTPLPCPSGWVNMGDVVEGSELYDENGCPCLVTAVTDVMRNRPCYRITFSDGQQVVADAEHEWFTATAKSITSAAGARKYDRVEDRPLKLYGSDQSHLRTFPSLVTTREIASTVRNPYKNKSGYNHRVPVAKPVRFPHRSLLVDPYLLGAWLGDGNTASASFTCADGQILDEIKETGQAVSTRKDKLQFGLTGDLQCRLRHLGVLDNKHIPWQYMRASIEQRRSLLQGLMDTDGHAGKTECEFTSIKQGLAEQVQELVASLGLKPRMLVGEAVIYGRHVSKKYRVFFAASRSDRPFRLARKLNRLKASIGSRSTSRRIVACQIVESVPVRCIEVNSPSHLYLCSKSFVPTHNSAVMKQWAQQLGSKGRRALIFTREMSEIKILFRMLAPLTDIPASQIRYGLDENRVERLLKAMKQIEGFPIFIDAVTSNVNDFRARVREMIRLEGIEIVFGDYLQLFHSGKKTDSRATEIGHVWRTMKDTAQDFNTRVVALAQFNREAYKSEKRPYFHQVEGSGEGEKAVDVGMVLWTELNAGQPGARPATIHVDYQRDEDAGTEVHLVFDGRIMEFRSASQPPIDFND